MPLALQRHKICAWLKRHGIEEDTVDLDSHLQPGLKWRENLDTIRGLLQVPEDDRLGRWMHEETERNAERRRPRREPLVLTPEARRLLEKCLKITDEAEEVWSAT